MRVRYICKGCGATVASAEATGLDDTRLGLHALTHAERADVLTLRADGLTVHTYCDQCAPHGGGVAGRSVH